MTPLVCASSVSRSPAWTVVSVSVTASSPRPVIPEDAYAVATAAAVPVSVVTDDASIVPLVAALMAFRSPAAAVPAAIVTFSLPRPLIPEDA